MGPSAGPAREENNSHSKYADSHWLKMLKVPKCADNDTPPRHVSHPDAIPPPLADDDKILAGHNAFAQFHDAFAQC